MDVALLLLLPLVGGYYCAKWSRFSRYRASREDGHRLYFRAALYGTVLFLLALVFRAVLQEIDLYLEAERQLSRSLHEIMKDPVKGHSFPFAITSLYALLLGLLIPKATNWLFDQDERLRLAIRDRPFERVLHQAYTRDLMISVSMENNKVYVGFITDTPDPAEEMQSIGLLPVFSGHRNNIGRIIFTGNYLPIYTLFSQTNGLSVAPADFVRVLPVTKIDSCNIFDREAFGLLAAQAESSPARSQTAHPRKPRRLRWARPS